MKIAAQFEVKQKHCVSLDQIPNGHNERIIIYEMKRNAQRSIEHVIARKLNSPMDVFVDRTLFGREMISTNDEIKRI